MSRTFGDAHAKIAKFGGNSKVVIAVPDIIRLKLNESLHDFIIIGCDGIFDKMTTEEVIKEAWSFND